MAVLVLLVLILGIAGRSTANWCVCKDGGSDAVLQKTLDYACGHGADCDPIKSNGACYNPNTVKAHCNYAVNSYFQKKGQAKGTCDFAGTAFVTTTDPGTNGCQYPASTSRVTPAMPHPLLVSLPIHIPFHPPKPPRPGPKTSRPGPKTPHPGPGSGPHPHFRP